MKRYKGTLHISAFTDAADLKISEDKKEEFESRINLQLDYCNYGGWQEDGSFDIDAESPVISLEGTLRKIEMIKAIYRDYQPDLTDEQIDIVPWVWIENFYSEADAKPTITTSAEHPKGVPSTSRDECFEFVKGQKAIQTPTPVSGTDNLITLNLDEIEFV